jgi:hypothetical protein
VLRESERRGAESHSCAVCGAGPTGAKACAAAGLAGIASCGKPLDECGPEELWRGLLELTLTDYRQVGTLIEQAEAPLDTLGRQQAPQTLSQVHHRSPLLVPLNLRRQPECTDRFASRRTGTRSIGSERKRLVS